MGPNPFESFVNIVRERSELKRSNETLKKYETVYRRKVKRNIH